MATYFPYNRLTDFFYKEIQLTVIRQINLN